MTRNPCRFRLSRAGIHQLWQYDEVFLFGDGRLLLRGKNGAGKSKALEMLLPFLLDGDSRKIDATGGGKTTLKWLMLDGWTGGANRLGYLWAEFIRQTEEGDLELVTVGTAVKASTSTGDAKPLFFVTDRKVGPEFPLDDPASRPSLERLKELVGADNWYDKAVDYRTRVARDLFGLTDAARYRNLVHLLYGLRRPTIGDRIESGELVKVLSDALPPLDDEILDRVARNLDDLETVRTELARLERTDAALSTFLSSYRGYLRSVLRGRVGTVNAQLEDLRLARRAAGDAERVLAESRNAESEAAETLELLVEQREEAAEQLQALRESAAYQALEDLKEKRTTLQAIADGTRRAWDSADLARTNEDVGAKRLSRETEEIGGEVAQLRQGLREARRSCRAGGIDESLLGEAPPVRAETVSDTSSAEFTGPGDESAVFERPRAVRLVEGLDSDLSGWCSRLEESVKAVTLRRRSAETLRNRFQEVERAEGEARRLRDEAEQLEIQSDGARAREDSLAQELLSVSVAFAVEVTDWAVRLPVHAPLLDLVAVSDDEDLPPSERAIALGSGQSLVRAAYDLNLPALEELKAERDRALLAVSERDKQIKALRAEKAGWEAEHDPEPPRSPYATAERRPDGGAPFYLLVDFLSPGDHAGLEAALEASGLLDAWVGADGSLLDPHTRDVLLHGDAPVQGRSLADVLRPVPGHGVSAETLTRLLRGIGLGESAAHSWVDEDGRWRLGAVGGAHVKTAAEYIGAGRREATRQRKIAELAQQITELEAELSLAGEGLEEADTRLSVLTTALREVPSDRALSTAWVRCEAAAKETSRLVRDFLKARTNAERSLAKAVELRGRVQAQATADGFPIELDALTALLQPLKDLSSLLGTLIRDIGRCRNRLTTHRDTHTAWLAARDARVGAEEAYTGAHRELVSARRRLQQLIDTIGESEQQILAREQEARQRLAEVERRIPGVRAARDRAHDAKVRAGVDQENKAEALQTQEGLVISGGAALRGPLGIPGLALAAGLDETDAAVEAFDAAQDGDVRVRIAALRALADDVQGRLGSPGSDVGDSLILKRGQELRDGLSGGYDARSEETDGIKRFTLVDDAGAHDVAVVGLRIRAAAEAAREQLSTREQEVFERYLLGELGDHLSRQVLAARSLVRTMNSTLEEVRSSHGVGARLLWEPVPDNEADVTAAVTLLERPAALRDHAQSARLRDALRRQIEEKRRADPSAGYAVHLRTALDYRSWFRFKVKVTDAADASRERVLSHRTALSQGEQRVVSYLVLFATAAAHFSSLGRGAPRAPRMILLDDAFAKVDEPTHGRLLGLLVDLDLDFVLTSERLWGCFPTVPSLHIYECLRDPKVRGVATLHFTWDGRNKHLVSA